ncbi:unnamed protein product, partial [marine sediment metagenome]
SMSRVPVLNRLSFTKKILKFEKEEEMKRVEYFEKFIDWGYIEDFNERINELESIYLLGFDSKKWNIWYENYITNGNPIDDNAIKSFLSLMVINWNDGWITNPADYNFDRIEIDLQPWFLSDFLILCKYFPNVRYADEY